MKGTSLIDCHRNRAEPVGLMKREQYWKRLTQYIVKDHVTHIYIIMSATCFGPFVPSSSYIYIYIYIYI